MSGHSKWNSIKHKKGVADAKRGKIFTSLCKQITVAARKGGGDTKFNFSLRLAVNKAKMANVPKDNIDRAIKRGTGELEGMQIEEKRYEGFGPGGVAIIVDALTDNSNRTVADLRHMFSKLGGNMEGSVSWQFDQKGIISVPGQAAKANDENWMLEAIDAGIDDVDTVEEDLVIITPPTNLQKIQTWLEEQGLETEEAALHMLPKDTTKLEDSENLEKLLDALDEHDDVEKVFHNAEL